jgi:hypothetical protein
MKAFGGDWLRSMAVATITIGVFAGSAPRGSAQNLVNLALGKTVARSSDVSSGRAANAVDGRLDTFWQPLMSDRQDDRNVWLRVDLGTPAEFDQAVLNFRTTTSTIDEYRIQTSLDATTWQTVYVRNRSSGSIPSVEAALFPAANGRYVRVDFTLNDPVRNFQLNEFELYDTDAPPPPVVLASVRLEDGAGRIYTSVDTILLRQGARANLALKARLSNGEDADLSGATIVWQSSKPAVASVEAAIVTAEQQGVAKVSATVTLDGVTKDASVWIDVYDPAALVADLWLSHPAMSVGIGQPAILLPGAEYPVIHVLPYFDMTLEGQVVRQDGDTVLTVPPIALSAGVEREIPLPGTAGVHGLYQIRLQLTEAGQPTHYDTLFFTVVDPAQLGVDQTRIAYVGADGALVRVPDYRGNRILDFSNAGYGGGGVRLPDVQARVSVEAGEGDDTARVQAALDEVARMPQDAEGIRGAVLLKRGRFEIGGTLFIRASGVVLRGEGSGEDGTILYAAGTARREILKVAGAAGRQVLEARTGIADLYVPSGTRSFHVEDPRAFAVGDSVIVRRTGNDRWIHHVGMDQIFERPGEPGSTTQWSPFDLDFDRVITRIDGNVVTVDAPLANAIERRWGGGELIRYDDPDRIEHVGVENLRVDVQFDPSVTAVTGGTTYFADENHAVDFASLDNVKNAWIRDVVALHLEHSLAEVLRSTKWVTVQDSQAIEMVSRIDGGRRYNFLLSGQLALVQRCHAETARHAFVVDSRVPGPNVFLDGDSIVEYATSEPHHRWSVGGLYDNIKSDIAIQDRAWLGSGHGWAGANYVAWNTEGELVVQQPPTAQNYAIGHVGPKVRAFAPNSDDPRPRSDGYWEKHGQHVSPRSLYLQQLQERLGIPAVENIGRTPVGGGSLDVPRIEAGLPLTKGIKVNNRWLAGFSSTIFDYVVELPPGTREVPDVRPHDERHLVELRPAAHPNGQTILILRDRHDPSRSVRYTVRFKTPAP